MRINRYTMASFIKLIVKRIILLPVYSINNIYTFQVTRDKIFLFDFLRSTFGYYKYTATKIIIVILI